MESLAFAVLLIFVACIFETVNCLSADDCGSFRQVGKNSDGYIKSPHYPDNYTNTARCIWLLKAPTGYKFTVTVPGMDGEESDGTCLDYLEIRDGGQSENLLYRGCDNSSSVTFDSTGRWLWVKFQSDPQNRNTGFRIDWEVVRNRDNGDDASERSPVASCDPVNFECVNKECVSQAYRCDGYDDCGCVGEGCDEHNCQGLGLSEATIVGIGVTLGFVVFVPLFLGIGLLDIFLKKRAAKELKTKIKEAQRRNKQKKLGALVTGTMSGVRPTTAASISPRPGSSKA